MEAFVYEFYHKLYHSSYIFSILFAGARGICICGGWKVKMEAFENGISVLLFQIYWAESPLIVCNVFNSLRTNLQIIKAIEGLYIQIISFSTCSRKLRRFKTILLTPQPKIHNCWMHKELIVSDIEVTRFNTTHDELLINWC